MMVSVYQTNQSDLIERLTSMTTGRTVVDNRIFVFGDQTSPDWGPLLEELTVREYVIAKLTSHGLSNREVADAALISVNTVKSYLRKIYRQLGVSSRGQLAQAFLR